MRLQMFSALQNNRWSYRECVGDGKHKTPQQFDAAAFCLVKLFGARFRRGGIASVADAMKGAGFRDARMPSEGLVDLF